jgi:UPF0755 protein
MDFTSKKFIFCVAGFLAVLVLFNLFFLRAPRNFPIGQIISVETGSSLRALSKELKNENVIRSRVVFETMVIIYGGEKHIAPGDYLFEKELPVTEIARYIAKGRYGLALVKITIPEGFDVTQIADAVSAKLPDFNKNNFLMEAQNKEGYLFPDTYFFFDTSSEKDVLYSMSNNFKEKIVSIQSEISASAKSEQNIIIMASIIEREAEGNADRTIISGILWNRISKNMPLQVDSAPETYKIKGLPSAPICNPGLKAIEAAMHPVSSSYLYYLHDKNGIIHYAETFAEHKQNKIKYLN